MTALDLSRETSQSATRRGSSREYKVIYVTTFPLFLVAAAMGRLSATATKRQSLLNEARELASATIPMAFMG